MTARDIVDDLAQARGELGDAIWEWLHAMASKGDDGSCFDDEGVYNLWWDGWVSPSAVHAVPFLVRLAVAEVYTAELFWVLGEIGHRTRGRRGAKAAAAHQAVLEQVPGLLEFVLTSRDERVRRHLLRLAACGPAQDVLPVVRSLCDDPELDDTTWAEALRAWLFLEPEEALPLAAQAVEHGTATAKVLTVTALAESGTKWRPRYGRAFAAAYDSHHKSDDPALGDPLRRTVESLVSHGRRKEAVRLLVPLLSPDRSHSTSEVALALAEELAERRKARATLLPAVLPLLTTRHPAEDAVRFVERFGRKNAEAIDALATLASTPTFPGSPP